MLWDPASRKRIKKSTAHGFQVSNCSGKTLQLSENVFLIPLKLWTTLWHVASSHSSSRDALCVYVSWPESTIQSMDPIHTDIQGSNILLGAKKEKALRNQ